MSPLTATQFGLRLLGRWCQLSGSLKKRRAVSAPICNWASNACCWPAQALSYKLGEYTIWELRRAAEFRLGPDFDIRAFHDFILSLGSVPLDILKDEVRRWVTEQTAGSSE